MNGQIKAIYRHPLKGMGYEAIGSVILAPGQTMPWDRIWAVAHEAASLPEGTPEWLHCSNFLRGAKSPALMAVQVVLDEATRSLTLTHPDRPAISVRPDDPADAARLVNWVAPLYPDDRAQPVQVYQVPGRGLTDSPEPTVTINNLASLRALSGKVGKALTPPRFRGNVWLDGLGPLEEFEWVGREVSLGAARLQVINRTSRCAATEGDPATGRRDLPMLALIEEAWGHRDFGVHAVVTKGGMIAIGDKVALL